MQYQAQKQHIFALVLLLGVLSVAFSMGSLAAVLELSDLSTLAYLGFNAELEDPSASDSTKPSRPSLFRPQAPSRVSLATGYYDGKKRGLPPGYKVDLNLDSNLNSFRTRQTSYGLEVAPSQALDIDSYLNQRRDNERRRIWDSLVAFYDVKKAVSPGDLADLLSQTTGFRIPVPPNPVFGIFGKPQISINVSGDVNLRAGWRWDSQRLGVASAFGTTQSAPVFAQDVNLNVSGQIGDKLRMGIDWNTRQQFDLNNRFNIGFTGNDDDIIKRVEVGNVQFPTPSAFINGGANLFGIRSDYQFGPLFLKTIASQQRGERRVINVRGGGVSRLPFQLRAYDYARNHFFVDSVYQRIWDTAYRSTIPLIPGWDTVRFYQIKNLEVWESEPDVTRAAAATDAVAIADLSPIRALQNQRYPDSTKRLTPIVGSVERGRFVRLNESAYTFSRTLGRLTINSLRSDRVYAVSYRVEGPSTQDNDDLDYGNLSIYRRDRDTLLLKMVYRPNMQPGFRTIWGRQMRNIFNIGQSRVNPADLRINIWYMRPNNDSADVIEGSSEKIVTILGVDRTNNGDGSPVPDGQFDIGQQAPPPQQNQVNPGGVQGGQAQQQQQDPNPTAPFFNAERGEIIFPEREPFNTGLVRYFATKVGNPALADRYVFKRVYDTTVEIARLQTDRDRFVITGEATGTGTSAAGQNRINLGAFNLPPGSVRVNLNGVPLREGQDYSVEYYTGQLTINKPEALLPNANLNVEYEAPDFLNIATRTKVGVRADYELFRKRNIQGGIGSTFMMFNQALIVDRVRVGEEPVQNKMLGFDGQINVNDIPWLTKSIDALPFVTTKEKSTLRFGGEIAFMFPEPNKRKSDVASDNGASVAYVDDFEAANRYISLGLTPTQWQHGSMPQDNRLFTTDESRNGSFFRGQLNWFQFFLGRTSLADVYPNRPIIPGRALVNDLKIRFDPRFRGIYNFNPEYVDARNPQFDQGSFDQFYNTNKDRMWAGMTRLFSTFNTNFDNENVDFLEIRMQVVGYDPTAEMWVDIGQISEDVIPNQTLNTEDGITAAANIPNNIIDPGEDVGYDALDNTQEQANYPFPLSLEGDPARDDYAFDFFKGPPDAYSEEDFLRYNNYENNAALSEAGQFPDREILNNNNGQTIWLDNSYFSYQVNLDANPFRNAQIVGEGRNGWFTYRIPLRRPSKTTGNPLFSNIQYVRVWFKGGFVNVNIADWRFTGGQWQRSNNFIPNVSPLDSVLQIQYVNVEENSGAPDNYSLPPGVQRPRQINNPDPNLDIRLNEQSMSVGVRNLPAGQERMAVRIFRPLDIFFYKQIKFFVHGDGSMPETVPVGASPRAMGYIRFGTDSGNYYEYRFPLLHPLAGGRNGWMDLGVDLEALTAIKEKRGLTDYFVDTLIQSLPGSPERFQAFHIVKGNPVLTRVAFFGFGIVNPQDGRFPEDLTTTMWVNELRLVETSSRTDWAGILNADLKLADIGNVTATFAQTNPFFHRLEERFGNRNKSLNWSVSMNAGLEKFLPQAMRQMKLPLAYTHTEVVDDPIFAAQSDVNVLRAADARFQQVQSDRIGIPNDSIRNAEAERARNDVRTRAQTLRVQDSWSLIGVKLGIPVDHWLIRETFNRLTLGYNYAQTFERSPVVSERFRWRWEFKADYTITIGVGAKPFGWAGDVPGLSILKDWKLNLPNNVGTSLMLFRERVTEQNRFLSIPSPVIRNFQSTRNGQMNWRLSEGDLLAPIIDYTFSTNSTLVPWEFNENGRQRLAGDLYRQVMFTDGRVINFGDDFGHTQNVTINFKPRFPDFLGINTFLDNNGSYSSNYTWRNQLQPDPEQNDIVKQTQYNASFRLNSNFRLKNLMDRWLAPIAARPSDTTKGMLSRIVGGFKAIFLDFETLTPSFRQENTALNNGVLGGSGFLNFWRSLGGNDQLATFGPSAAYQLGFVKRPSEFLDFGISPAFPFISASVSEGLRPKNAILQDNYSQKSTLDMRTNRQLWQGAVLDLTWKSEWQMNQNYVTETDPEGRILRFSNFNTVRTLNRSYFSLPGVLFFIPFQSTIPGMINLYNDELANSGILPSDSTAEANAERLRILSRAFRDGLETFSAIGGALGQILPAINWSFRWDGLEKLPFVKGIARRISLEHTYESTYQENRLQTDAGEFIQGQTVQLGFRPLIGINATFDETKLKGTATARLTYNTRTTYNLQTASSIVASDSQEEIKLDASYNRRGFKLAILGMDLQNDMEFALQASYRRNRRFSYDVLRPNNAADGQTLDGNTQILIEPSARYSVSNRVTSRFFFRYETTINAGAAAPGFSTTEVGMDIRISVAGGR